jgi:hypothetical protein
MKKITALLACVLSFSAQADWRLIHTDATNAQFYIDQTNIALIDGYQRVWVLNNLEKANSRGTRSFRSVEEYDCINKMARVMQIAAFDGPMGQGELRPVGLARRRVRRQNHHDRGLSNNQVNPLMG